MMALTMDEIRYDFMVTEGRWLAESDSYKRGIAVGRVQDYLLGSYEVDYYESDSNWLSNKDLRELFLEGVHEGHTYGRTDSTAEELFIEAHELDVKTFGLKNLFVKVVREPLTPLVEFGRV